jgi:hypothetical protein
VRIAMGSESRWHEQTEAGLVEFIEREFTLVTAGQSEIAFESFAVSAESCIAKARHFDEQIFHEPVRWLGFQQHCLGANLRVAALSHRYIEAPDTDLSADARRGNLVEYAILRGKRPFPDVDES